MGQHRILLNAEHRLLMTMVPDYNDLALTMHSLVIRHGSREHILAQRSEFRNLVAKVAFSFFVRKVNRSLEQSVLSHFVYTFCSHF